MILYTDTTTTKVPPFYQRLESFFVDYDMVPLLVHVYIIIYIYIITRKTILHQLITAESYKMMKS